MAVVTLSLPPKLIPSHPMKRRLPQINPTQSKDLCLNPEKLPHQYPSLFHHKSASLPLTALALPFILDPQDAAAVGGDFGILEGRLLSLIHPTTMGGLFLLTLYAGYLGAKWRRTRTIQEEINELEKQVKKLAADGGHQQLDSKIQQLTQERKELIKGSYKDKHFTVGSILLGLGVFEAVYGGLNTWFRTGKLSLGPHLFTGATITVLWAAAASLVSQMQKGNNNARTLHIALNSLNLLLFASQIPTGIEMICKVFESTTWP